MKDQTTRRQRPGDPEGVGLYASRCSIHAIAEILTDQGRSREQFIGAAGSGAAGVFEPFAFVVCNGCLATLEALKEQAVSLRTGSALPLSYGKMLQEEGGDGD